MEALDNDSKIILPQVNELKGQTSGSCPNNNIFLKWNFAPCSKIIWYIICTQIQSMQNSM